MPAKAAAEKKPTTAAPAATEKKVAEKKENKVAAAAPAAEKKEKTAPKEKVVEKKVEEKKEKVAEKKPTVERVKNNVRVSSHRSKFLYADITKYLLNDGEKEVLITALNASIADAVSVVEMLKSQKLVKVTKINTSRGQEESARRPGSDKIEIVVTKDKDFDKIYAEQQKEREAKKAEKKAAAEQKK